jgi:Zn-dependent protease with chaperone function
MSETLAPSLESGRTRLPGIAPEAYRHPLDQQATAALRALPGFEMAVARLSQHSVEKLIYHEELASAVRVTPRQCSRIYKLLREACGVLDVAEPALFLSQTPIANAFAVGRDNPTMLIQTGLVELMTEEELLGVIAHELGHIHCGHTIYLLAAAILETLAKLGGDRLGVGDLFSLSFRAALLEWTRKAEFTADRAAVLVTQNPEVVFSTLFKLTGGSPKVFEQMDRDEYLRQADDYERPDRSRLDKFYQVMIETGRTHPIPVLRAREALRYGASDEFKAILGGEYARRGQTEVDRASIKTLANATITCPVCGTRTDTAFTFCTGCGADLKVSAPDFLGAASKPEVGASAATAGAAPVATPEVDGVTDA